MVNGLEVHHTAAGALNNGGSEDKVSQWQAVYSGSAINEGLQRLVSTSAAVNLNPQLVIGNQSVGINPKWQSQGLLSEVAVVDEDLLLDVWQRQ